jgi:ABC-2 type transport system permease protein
MSGRKRHPSGKNEKGGSVVFLTMMKYEIKKTFRAKEVIVWLILFPIIMGTLYKFTLGNIFSGNQFSAVRLAVVQNTDDGMFRNIMDNMEKTDPPYVKLTYCSSEEEALSLLYKNDVTGVVVIDPAPETGEKKEDAFALDTVDTQAILDQYLSTGTVNAFDDQGANDFLTKYLDGDENGYVKDYLANFTGGEFFPKTHITLKLRKNGMDETMAKKMVMMYINMQNQVREMMDFTHMTAESGDMISKAMNGQDNIVEPLQLTTGNTDPFSSYMYNLIAMVAIFGSLVGVGIAQTHQADMSPEGARRSCSSLPKSISILACFFSYCISMAICVSICITFLTLVLGVDFGSRLPLVYLSGICGGIMGVAMGFFLGCVGKMSPGARSGFVMALNMTLCFLSGYIVMGIKGILEHNAPIVNDLNPAAIICDSFYYLNMDAGLERFIGQLLKMGIYTAIFVILGFILTRRKKYASL